MASPFPGHRLRKKTSDITDYLRAGHTSRSRAGDVDEPSPSTALSKSEPEPPAPKRSNKIPFLGPQRKTPSHPDAYTSASSAGRQSDSDVRVSNTNSRSPSLGSKLVAHFVPSRHKLLDLSSRKPARPPISDGLSDTLVPRQTSLDSTSSDNRSTTPRPQSRPIITVSLPPDDLEGYDDMFTTPTANIVEDSQLTRSPTPPPSDSQSQSRDAGSSVKRRSSRSPQETSRLSRVSRKRVGSPVRHLELGSTDAEDSEVFMSDCTKPSPPMSGSTSTAEKRRTLPTMPYTQPRSIMKHSSDRPPRPPAFPPPPPPTYPPSSALPAPPSQTTVSRKSNGSPPLRVGSSAFPPPPPPTDPPSSALPAPPTQTTLLPKSPSSPPPIRSSALRRQRVQTLAAVPTPHITFPFASSSLPSTPASRLANCKAALAKKATEDPRPTGKVNFDIEKASADQLRQALTLQNEKFDELVSYLLEISEAHVTEKHVLLKTVALLEQEAMRREIEIKGLTWLVTNNPRRPELDMMSNAASKSTSALELEPGADKQLSGVKSTFSHSKFNPADSEDSDAESHQTMSGAEESGPESSWGSGASGGESSSSSQGRKVKHNHTLTSSFYRTRTPAESRRGAEASASAGISPSSSTPSLSLGTLTPATTVTSLSAMSESQGLATRSQDPVVAAAILALATETQRGKEERRAIRVSNRLSESSVTTPSPSASYAANLKRARSPSIAQVLAQSPKMEHGRDKLPSYGAGGSASS